MEDFLQKIDTLTIHFTLIAVLLPLLAFIINALTPGKRDQLTGWVSTISILISCVCSAFVFAKVWNMPQIHRQQLWFTVGSTRIYAGILLNNLSVLMLMLVNLIALPVHIYSTAYMWHDAHYNRYFAYLSLFCFSMLALVVVDNLVLFYVFWELVGFSSYLLIGFWSDRERAVQANKKAFIMNRIGDIGLLTAILIIFSQYHTFDILQLFRDKGLVAKSIITNRQWIFAAGHLSATWQYVAFGGIFLAVAAKSAQFPLHTWLPDAMVGPTSVSALIHAATMVAAGVFLLGRVYPMFNATELTILAVIGCFTAFMAATIALVQNDLKRILAYSTISQLGYMVMAMGIGAYASSLFHLVTHAFFKCLLFLVAGIIIHEMAHIRDNNGLDIDPQNIQNMGGLRKKLPFTFIAALIGGLALVGLPLTSGYLSKDGILIQAFEWSDGKSGMFKLIPVLALLTTWLTAFYVARLIIKVFFGELKLLKIKPDLLIHINDGGWKYKLPMVMLAVACFFPLFSFNPLLFEHSWLYNAFSLSGGTFRNEIYHIVVPVGVSVISLVVIYWTWSVYIKGRSVFFPQSGLLFRLACNEWYFNSIYNTIIVKPILALSSAAFWFDRRIIDGVINYSAALWLALAKTAAWFDQHIIDGFLNLLANLVQATGNLARRFQGGKVQYYLFSMLVIVLVLFLLKIWF